MSGGGRGLLCRLQRVDNPPNCSMVTPQKTDLDCSCGESDKLLKGAWPPKNLKIKSRTLTLALTILQSFNPGGSICAKSEKHWKLYKEQKKVKNIWMKRPKVQSQLRKAPSLLIKPKPVWGRTTDGRQSDLHQRVLEPLRPGGKFSWGVTLEQRATLSLPFLLLYLGPAILLWLTEADLGSQD